MSFIDQLKSMFGNTPLYNPIVQPTREERIAKDRDAFRRNAESLGWTVLEEPEVMGAQTQAQPQGQPQDNIFEKILGNKDKAMSKIKDIKIPEINLPDVGEAVSNVFKPVSIRGTGRESTPEEKAEWEAIMNGTEDRAERVTPNRVEATNGGSSRFQWKTNDKQPFPQKWDSYIDEAADEYEVDPNILASLIANESGGGWAVESVGDQGATYGLGQINLESFYGSAGFSSPEEYREALKDPRFSLREAARIYRYKIDTFGNGDPFVGLMRYNGGGPQALEYAKAAYKRIGYEIPKEYV